MNRIAIVHPTSLLARELRDRLDQRPDLCSDLQLFSTREEEIGSVTEVRGAAGLIQQLDGESMSTTDLVFVCGNAEAVDTAVGLLPAAILKVILSPTGDSEHGTSRVAGSKAPVTGRTLRSPHPAVVALAHLLTSLTPLAPRQAVATVILPASIEDQPGLDELYEQTGAILNFTGQRREEIFGHQVAFNLMPVAAASDLRAQLAAVPGTPPAISLQLLQGGIFHCLSISMWIEFDADPGADKIGDRLREHPSIDVPDEAAALGPIDGAASSSLLVGEVTPGAPNSYWLWAVSDNLTHSGAHNAVELAAELLAAR